MRCSESCMSKPTTAVWQPSAPNIFKFSLLTSALAALGLATGCSSTPNTGKVQSSKQLGMLDANSLDSLEDLLSATDMRAVEGDRLLILKHGDVWKRMTVGFKMDENRWDSRIEAQRSWFISRQPYLDRLSARASRYLYYTVKEAERRGMPTELALLPIIESSYDPAATSSAAAAGLWQFIPSTGRIYGLKQTSLYDGRRAKATVVGTDPDTDLAVIKIELDKLPVLPFKLSGNEVGDVVLAIGNPFGVGQTVTQGIISATGRSDLGINTYEDFIQTDAAINPGNSGGALIDVAGNLIGVNTAIFSQSGGSLGIGFAIPAKICEQVLNAILKDGRVVRGWLGLSLVPVTQSNVLETKETPAVVVGDVLANGPAAQAGLKAGDKILQVNNEVISSPSHLVNYVALQAPNSSIQLLIERNGEKLTLDVIVGERKPITQQENSQFIPLPKR